MSLQKVVLYFLTYPEIRRNFEDIEFGYISSIFRQNNYEIKSYMFDESKINYDEIECFNPDLIGYCICFNNIEDSFKSIDIIHEKVPNAKIFAFGHSITLYGADILEKNKNINIGILGESESAVMLLIEQLRKSSDISKVPGLMFNSNDGIKINPQAPLIENLDILPFMDRDYLPVENRSVLLSTSRGCTSNCSFCRRKQLSPNWRGRSAKNIVDEIETIVKNKKINTFMVNDNSFEDPDKNLSRLKSICSEIINRNLNITYNAYFRGDFYKKADKEIEALLRDSGLLTSFVGIESGNEEDLRLLNKRQNVEDNYKTMDYFESLGFYIIPSFINFTPYSNFDRLKKNLDFLRKYRQCIRFFTFLDVLTYTQIYETLKSDNLIVDKDKWKGEYSYNYFQNDNSVCEYLFKSSDVQGLADYSKQFMVNLNEKYNNLYRNLLFYQERHFYQVLLLRKNIEYNNPKQEYFDEHINCLKKLYDEFDSKLYMWVSKLIQLTNEGWDEKKAAAYTDEYQIIENIQKFNFKVSKLRNDLIKKLYRLGFGAIVEAQLD